MHKELPPVADASEWDMMPTEASPSILIVTGLSGSGRTTAVNALEDMGYETLNNVPVILMEELIRPLRQYGRPMAVGVGTKARGFSAQAMNDALSSLRSDEHANVILIFLDCANEVLISRFSQTRRRHPLAPAENAAIGIARERDLMAQLRDEADLLIDTTHLSPHDLKAQLLVRFSLGNASGLAVTVQSFSYKHGAPREADMVFDCRFLKNPYWEESLRTLDGRDQRVQDFIRGDGKYDSFFLKLCELLMLLLPAYKAEGKAYFSIALGCTGGRHRSVAISEALAKELDKSGWPVSVRHRELERRRNGR